MDVACDPGLAGAVPFRFACQRCARCCSGGSGFVWITAEEIEAMARSLGSSSAGFSARYVRRVPDPHTGAERLSLREEAAHGGRCALLVGANECAVYDARPAHCRTFPYWPGVLAGGNDFEAARATCPGIAVVVDAEARARAFAALEAFRAGLAPSPEPRDCCLGAAAADELYVTALEADFAAERGRASEACRLGAARPLGCRLAAADADARDRAWAAQRALERDLGYPLAFGPIREMLRARGVECDA